MSAKVTMSQRRAKEALKNIKTFEKREKSGEDSHLASYINRLPSHIVMNGLGQALATELAAARLNKKEENRTSDHHAHETLYKTLSHWVTRRVFPGSKDLLDALLDAGRDKYIHAQAEALAYLEWLKKFSQAYLKGDQK